VFDLNTIDNPENRVLGFCRALLPATETLAWVGFTRLRPTRFREKLDWLRSSKLDCKPTRIALYDLSASRCLREIELAAHGMDLIFSIVASPGISQADPLLAHAGASTCAE
jgi:hypothetical protein